MTAALSGVLEFAPPLVLAALGGVLSERAGVVNIGLEGMMRAGAFAAAVGAFFTGSPWLGLACGAAASVAAAAVHAALSLRFRADQVVSGIAINLVTLGLTTFLLEATFGSSGVTPPVPALPRDSAGRTALAWVALALPLLLHVAFSRTAPGLRIRAVGENPHAAAASGVRVLALRAACVLGSGALSGLGGAALSVGILGQFDSRMPAGQGFMALAAMVFGPGLRWARPPPRSSSLVRTRCSGTSPSPARRRPAALGGLPRAALCADAARARRRSGAHPRSRRRRHLLRSGTSDVTLRRDQIRI